MPRIEYDSMPPNREDIRNKWNDLYDEYKMMQSQRKSLADTLTETNYAKNGPAWNEISNQLGQMDIVMEQLGNDLLRVEMDVKIYC